VVFFTNKTDSHDITEILLKVALNTIQYRKGHTVMPIINAAWVRARLCKLQKGCTRLAAASDKI
jgi:hypothetical protein